jgi:hypothetical protein
MPGIFLLSSERSGTNLLKKRLCDSNGSICNVPPVHLLRTLGYWESQFGDLAEDSVWESLITFALRCCYERAVPWKYIFTYESVKKNYQRKYKDQRSLVRLTDVFYSMYASEEGKNWYFCKDLWLFDFSNRIANEIPDSYFIQLVRDPRDYVVSQLKRPYSHCSVIKHAECWNSETIRSSNALVSLAIKDKSFFVTYESFLGGELVYINAINQWLNIAEQELFITDSDSYDFYEWKNIHLPTMRDNFNKYKENLSNEQINTIESICWVAMRNMGYKTEAESRPSISKIFKVWDTICFFVLSPIKHKINKLKFRNESINRWAARGLVDDLEKRYR